MEVLQVIQDLPAEKLLLIPMVAMRVMAAVHFQEKIVLKLTGRHHSSAARYVAKTLLRQDSQGNVR